MDIQPLITMAAGQLREYLAQQPGDTPGTDTIVDALLRLFGQGDGSTDAAASGLAGLVTRMLEQGGLAELASSWLGAGDNAGISAAQVRDLFDSQALADFASRLGVSESGAVDGLQSVLPALVDQASSDSASPLEGLLSAAGGVSGMIGMAGRLFGR